MILTQQLIVETSDDDALFGLLGAELERRLSAGRTPTDEFVDALVSMPVGLRAMAATYELDVSLTLDDLGWHFGNWHHEGLARQTLFGLRELEIGSAGSIRGCSEDRNGVLGGVRVRRVDGLVSWIRV